MAPKANAVAWLLLTASRLGASRATICPLPGSLALPSNGVPMTKIGRGEAGATQPAQALLASQNFNVRPKSAIIFE